jgi:hypothetical protein
MDESWTILELAELAAQALATPGTSAADGRAGSGRADSGTESDPDSGPARANGRVRDVPNERLIRWYGTVGLVDPPLSRRGRVARYGRRHLLQLVAVKRRQAEGKSLAEIQEELTGVPDEALEAVARIPALGTAPAQGASPGPAPSAGQGRFWARHPQQPTAEASTAGSDSDDAGLPTTALVPGIRLAPGVMLLLDGAAREPGPEDVTAIVNAARPLLRELASRGLGAPGRITEPTGTNPQMGAGHEHGHHAT